MDEQGRPETGLAEVIPPQTEPETVTRQGNEQVIRIPFFQLIPSPTNPRQASDPAKDAELAKSIKENFAHGGPGVLEPLLVRALGDWGGIPSSETISRGKFEVVVGSRRFKAAQKAGLDDVPCIVREMSDEEAREIQIVENLQRADVSAIDEARGLKDLVEGWMRPGDAERKPVSVESVAKKIGKSASYVYQRLKLCDGVPAVQQAMEQGRLSPGHAVIIARMPPEAQKMALEICFPSWAGKDQVMPALSVRELAKSLEQHAMYDTRKAIFPVDDAGLVPAAGACTVCPKLAKNNHAFKGIEPSACTDKKCYDSKQSTFIEIKIAQSKADGKSLIGLFDKWWNGPPKPEDAYLNRGQFREARTQKCKSAVEGIWTDGFDVGKTIAICRDRSCKIHWGDAVHNASHQTSKPFNYKRDRKITNRAFGLAFSAVAAKITKLEPAHLAAIHSVVFDGASYELTELDDYKSPVMTEISPLLKTPPPKKISEATIIKAILFMVARVSRKPILGVDAKKYRKQALLEIKAEEAAAKKPQLKTGKSNVAPKTVKPKSRPKR